METWKPVVGYETLYEVSDAGRVRSKDRDQCSYGGRRWARKGRLLSPTLARYYVVTLTDGDGRHVRKYVHRLVLEAFVGPCPVGMEACHGPAGALDNSLTNLRWDTDRANVMDKLRDGTMPVGESHHKNRYSEDQIKQVIAMLSECLSMAEIERQTGVKANTVSQVKHGRQWAHLKSA